MNADQVAARNPERLLLFNNYSLALSQALRYTPFSQGNHAEDGA